MRESLQTFLAFLAEGMRRKPEMIQPLDQALMRSMGELVKKVKVSCEEDLGDEALI